MIRTRYASLTLIFALMVSRPLFLSPSAVAGTTGPVLALGEVKASRVAPGAILDIIGLYGFDDLIQVNYPVTVLAYQGTRFVRFVPGQAAVSGDFEGLADGLSAGEISFLESRGEPDPDARILRLEPGRIVVSLPSSIVDGVVDVVLYLQLPSEGTVISNVLSATLISLPEAQQ